MHIVHSIQDLTGGMLVPVQGVDSPLFALEVSGNEHQNDVELVLLLHLHLSHI